ITGIDGDFSLSNVKNGDVIQISFVGYITQEIVWNGQPLNITLKDDTQTLDEVVVTALGMKREKKALGYAMTELKGDELNANVINPVQALQGKVAGVEISSSDGGMFGASKILIRGSSTLGKNNQPIYVVDGIILDNGIVENDADWASGDANYGNELKNLNPDDFETVSVLKGAAATALYGSRGLNGAVVITTKSGKGKKGLGINVTQTFGFDRVTGQPDLQNEYMEGYFGGYTSGSNPWNSNEVYAWDPTGKYPSLLSLNRDYSDTGVSFGPRFSDYEKLEWFDGSIIDSKANKNNFKDAYGTGFNTNTNVAISGGNETTSFYSSLSYKYADGTLPNNSFERFSLLAKGSHKISKDVELEASITFANSTPRNAQRNIGENFVNGTWDRTYDASYFRDKYKGDHGGLAQNQYGDKYGSVPGRSLWWNIWENDYRQKETVVRPDVKLTVEFTPWLKWITEGSYNYYYTRAESKNPGSGYANEGGSYTMSLNSKEQTNLNTNFMFNKSLGEDWNLNGFLRGEYFHSFQQYMSEGTSGGLIIPNQYFLTNGKNGISSSGKISNEKTMLSVAFQAGISWRDQVFVDVTGRNDWSSALVYADGHGNYSYFYPSINGSWLLHETFREKLPQWISFMKIRGSWAQVGNDTDPYTINSAYTLTTTDNGNKVYSLSVPSSIYSQGLKPERKTSWEVGLDWRFLANRIGVDFTYYKENTKNQIMSVSVPSVSGVSSQLINAGNIQNSGLELALNTTPFENKDWTWDLNFTWTKNWSKIVELSDLVANYIALQGTASYGNFRIGSVAKVGGVYGLLMSDSAPKIDEESGKMMLNYSDTRRMSYIQRNGVEQEVGSMQPDFLGGLSTSLRYKNWTLRASLDARFGGKVASYNSRYGTAYGYTETSMQYRDPAHGGVTWTSKWDNVTYSDGIIPDGIIPVGTKISQPGGGEYIVGTSPLTSAGETYASLYEKGVIEPTHAGTWSYFTNSWGQGVLNDNWFVTLNYIALRDLSLSYSCPSNWASKIGAKSLTLTANGHNLGYLLNSMPNHENPEAVAGTTAAEFRIRQFSGITSNFTFTINASF
ncbi:MAG: SusC/RagA family TonB-linked outer membrane protein, partial [Phocaeicola sp.]|uniref:SusC/RagA family TonB-linked outer membrane protein n=1 Tax=Phocaeicola sp. TaxID=2773926 RepID=UPI0023C1EEF0